MHDVSEMPARLATFLTKRDGSRSATVTGYEPMVGGYSRLMATATVDWSDGATEKLVLRGDPPPGKAMMETDRDAEWALLAALTKAEAIRMPLARWYDGTGDELGTKCIVLEHVDGRSLQQILNDTDPAAGVGQHPMDVADTVAMVHSMDPDSLGDALERPDDWAEYLGRLIDRFRRADRGHAEPIPFLRYTAAWLDANRPPPLPLRVVHSDFQAANIMIGADGQHQLIDWELTHIGDPREDLGYYNVYSTSSPPNLLAADPEAFLARYRERTGFSEEAVNMATMAYFSSLAAITVYAQILVGVGAMAEGANSGITTTYIMNALTIGHSNYLAGCAPPTASEGGG